ncbi:MAG: 5-histidylcysteine sulfoxide synthase [Candidatus Krumholzibacteria bacterium]|nr:5-histidylcysteine sulfoxide synthase [Candidatus Krumholzibacteria bacterium]
MTLKVMPSPLLDTGTPEAKRQEIRSYFQTTWELYEKLFEVMACDEAYFLRADPLRHPLIFYLGHTAVFFINKLVLAKSISERVNPRFESIFAIGVDEMSWDDLDEKNYEWPTVSEVMAYRNQVRLVVENAINDLPLEMPVSWDDPHWVILMGIEHERIHLETSSVLMRQLPLDMVKPHPEWAVCEKSGEAPANVLRDVPGGPVALGRPGNRAQYGWDNEYGQLESDVASFRASSYLVSNAEFREFVEAGGYRTERWWTPEGWDWRTFRQAEHPAFWIPVGDRDFRLRCFIEEIAMPRNWPVEVNQLEAKAFCNWKAEVSGRPVRLPTEEEWYRLLEVTGLAGHATWDRSHGNINLASYASSCPVTENITAGFGDVVGNVWQWTETPISGFPGFRVHPLYDDFSTPTFDTRHNLIKGGSWISTGNEATRDSRYAFRRHFYQHAGFRYIESEKSVEIAEDIYESDALISQYCEFHYGRDYYGVPNFMVTAAEICRELTAGKKIARALDLGCATGRATFELARFCDHVTGIDFSARFIKVGHLLQKKGYTRYAIPEEGDLVSYHEKSLADMDLEGVRNKVEFWQGDAHNLKEQFTNYDLVLACNLIDRLYDPTRFLDHITPRINAGGLLVLLSPYTWLEEFTPKDKWLGGLKIDGENVATLDGLRARLEPGFRLVTEPRNVEFVIRETARKFQHTTSQMTVWEKIRQ